MESIKTADGILIIDDDMGIDTIRMDSVYQNDYQENLRIKVVITAMKLIMTDTTRSNYRTYSTLIDQTDAEIYQVDLPNDKYPLSQCFYWLQSTRHPSL